MHSMWKPAISSSFKWLSSTCEQTGALGVIAILYGIFSVGYLSKFNTSLDMPTKMPNFSPVKFIGYTVITQLLITFMHCSGMSTIQIEAVMSVKRKSPRTCFSLISCMIVNVVINVS